MNSHDIPNLYANLFHSLCNIKNHSPFNIGSTSATVPASHIVDPVRVYTTLPAMIMCPMVYMIDSIIESISYPI